MLCFNFRADRVREILTAMLDPDFSGFTAARGAIRGRRRHDAIQRRARQALANDFLPQTCEILGEVVAAAGRTQFAWRRPRNIRMSPIF